MFSEFSSSRSCFLTQKEENKIMEKLKHNFFTPAGITATVASIGLIITGLIVTKTLYRIKAASDVISVTGSAERVITSDVVKWRGTFTRNISPYNLQEGYAQMKADLTKITNYLKQNGIEEKSITIVPITVNPIYEQEGGAYYGKFGPGGTLTGYTLFQEILIEASDVKKTTDVAQNSSALINQGVPFSSMPLEYYYSKLADVKIEMLAEATKNSKLRAEKIAESANSRLGKLKSASMGVLQITPVNSVEVSDYGYYDTSSIEKKVTAVVRTSFTLK